MSDKKKAPSVYMATQEFAIELVTLQRRLFDAGFPITAAYVNRASNKLGWESADKMEAIRKATK